MAISYRKAISVTPTLLADSTTTPGGQAVLLHHNGGGNIFIGDKDVSTTAGFTLASGTTLAFVVDGSEAIYGVTATTTLTIQVFRANSPHTPNHG